MLHHHVIPPLKQANHYAPAWLNECRYQANKLMIVFLCGFLLSGTAISQSLPSFDWLSDVGCVVNNFPEQQFFVNKYGAKNDGKQLSTKAIQRAIDECAAKGGGIVTFLPGNYLTGAVFLKSGVHLIIPKGVCLLGSQNLADFPEIDTRVAGTEMKWPAGLINVIDQQGVTISGEGTVNSQGKYFWDKYWEMRKIYEPKGLRWVVDQEAKRIRTILVQHSSNIHIQGLTLKNAAFWTVHLLYSDHITVAGIKIRNNEDGHGPSTDGIDVDSSTRILIENCDIDCNDDNFCMKAGRDWDGLRVNKPTEYVVIRDCVAHKGGGLLTLGSETSGGIRHVLAYNLTAKGTDNGLRIKSATTRGGTVEDIYFQHIHMDSVSNAINVGMNWNPSYSYTTLPEGYSMDSIPAFWKVLLHPVEPPEAGIPHFKNIFIEDITVNFAKKAIVAEGLPESELENFSFSRMKIVANEFGNIDFAKGWSYKKVRITTNKNAD
jgi:polygalacturonase